MAMSKSPFVLIFSVLLSFGLFCSAACDNARWPQHEPREQYEQCLRRCEWETRGAREQQQCEQDCERQFRRQEERQHGLNSVDPSRKPEEQEQQRQLRQCQERCERQEQGPWEQQQCQRRCLQQYGRQEEERQHGRHGLNPEDPWRQPEQQRQLKQCQERCQRQEQGPQEKQQCQRQCQQKYGRQQREQPEERRRKFQECQERCQQEEPEQRQQEQCQRKCREQFEEQGRDADVDCQRPYYRKSRSEEEGEEEQEQGQESNNPFFFPSRRSFQTRIREEEGRFRVLQRFAENSPVLSNINYFRLATFEANPHTFIIPHHSDSESIYVVTNGRGIITLVDQENKESYNVEPGTVLIVPAGCAVYLVNQDNNDKLRIAVLNLPLNNPGKFAEFFPATVEPPSYLQVFSDRILQAVFNTPRETLERVIQRQRGQEKQGRQQGMFRRIEPQQIRALSQQATSPRKGSEGRAINLMNQSPRYSNQFGRLQEVCPEQFEQLRNMNVLVSAVQLNEGAIFVPHYNSRATFVVLVTEGNARVEMACPHLSRQSQGSKNWEPEHEEEEEEQSRFGEYRKITARLSPGDVFVVPAAHPVTFVAENEKLKAIGFGINAHNNKRIFVAGKNNLIRQMDSEAKEISFGAPARLIDEVFNKNPRESYFMPLSQRGSREDEDRRGSPLASFLDITRLF